jgi:L-amino acid N-acyltransferase YncA
MTAEVWIRDAIGEDLPQIIMIYNASIPLYLATADTEPITVESRLSWFAAHTPDTYPLWVVENSQNQVIGWLGFQRFYGRPAYAKTAELSIYLHPEHQGKGLGKLLLSRAIAEGENLGLQTLLGFIFAHNQPSLRLFTGLQFEQWGFLPRVAILNHQERDLVILGRRLTT